MFSLSPPCKLLPGLLLCGGIGLLAYAGEMAESALVGKPWIEGLVLAILLGMGARSLFGMPARFHAGIAFSAKTMLEIAVLLLGASISFATLSSIGFPLFGGIAGVVALSLLVTYALGRLFGLPAKLATLVACGNSICGNSAIAAAAPVIDAHPDDVASSIAFTAVLGVANVLILPFAYVALKMSAAQYGVLAGLTVYAVPQVLAAAAPAGVVGIQVGTLVKLVRVLMLGPVIFALNFAKGKGRSTHISAGRMVPWFIVGFALLAAARSAGLIPEQALPALKNASSLLTLIAMGGLGLSVDIRSVMQAGGRVTLVAALSLLLLTAISMGLIAVLGIA